MKKIIFVDIPMKEMSENLNKQCYKGDVAEVGTPVIFPINAVLSQILHKEDSIKVVLLATITNKAYTSKNIEIFKEELKKINKSIGAKIEYETIKTDFVESKKNHEVRLRAMLSKIEENAELYADMTFGQKTIPMLLMCVLYFAEKFFNADVKKIIYGKVEFVKNEDGVEHLENAELYDLTSLYYLNNLIGSMQASSDSEALKALDAFFAL
ncbi:MAG: hypothetical protein ACTTKH_05305 [Treponema sp.]